MFTGIVEEIGTVRHVEETPSGRRLEIGAAKVLDRLAVDDSIDVDATTALVSRQAEGDGARLRFALPKAVARYVVEKGFITLDGVSLTVAALAKTTFDVALIPHSAQRTTLGSLREGDPVNVEVD